MPQRTRSHRLTSSTRPSRRPGRRHQRRRAQQRIREFRPGGALLDEPGPVCSSPAIDPAAQTTWRPVTAALVCLLFGSSVSLAAGGLIERLGREFGGHSNPSSAVIAGVLLAMAIGVRVPQSFAIWVCALSWRRFVTRGRSSALSDVLIGAGPADRSFHWLALSVIALLCGVVLAMLPVSVRAAMGVHDWIYARFVWPTASLMVLQAGTVFLAALIPLITVGFAISCAHHVSCRFGKWESRATGWLAIGAGGGLLFSSALQWLTGRADLTLIAAALPALLVALLCAGSGSVRSAIPAAEPGPAPSPLPMWSDRWPTLLRGSIVLVGCSAAWAITAWTSLPAVMGAADGLALPALFSAFGAGILGGSRAKRCGLRSIGGFGVACSAVGVITASATFLASGAYRALPGMALSAACLSLGGLGFAMGYGHQTLLHRVASRSAVGATILGRLFVGSALLTWIAAGLLTGLLTVASSLAMLALLLTALGGALIIHEPGYSPRTRRVRLCGVFAAMVGMITLAPRSEGPRARERVWKSPPGAADAAVQTERLVTGGFQNTGPNGR